MIDLLCENAIPMNDVPKHVPKRNGKKVHYSTVYRWATKGVRGRVLETIMVGGIRYTTVEAVGRFLACRASTRPSVAGAADKAIDDLLRDAGV